MVSLEISAGLCPAFFIFVFNWSVSSVGLEHCLDRAGVVGSNPIHSTLKNLFCESFEEKSKVEGWKIFIFSEGVIDA